MCSSVSSRRATRMAPDDSPPPPIPTPGEFTCVPSECAPQSAPEELQGWPPPTTQTSPRAAPHSDSSFPPGISVAFLLSPPQSEIVFSMKQQCYLENLSHPYYEQIFPVHGVTYRLYYWYYYRYIPFYQMKVKVYTILQHRSPNHLQKRALT